MQPETNDQSSVSPALRHGSDRLANTGPALLIWVVALLTVTSVSLVFVTPVSGSTTHATAVSGGGDLAGCAVITGPGTYRLIGDVTDSPETVCIDIQSSDVIFDGGEFVVDGVSASGNVGIRADGNAGGLTNVTVRNVVVTEWADGLRYDDADASLVESARFERNGNGTVLADVSNVVVHDVDVVDAAVRGVSLEWSTRPITDGDNRVSDVRITGTQVAIRSDLPRTTIENVVTDGAVNFGSENVISSVVASRLNGGGQNTLTNTTVTLLGLNLTGDRNRLSDVSVTGGIRFRAGGNVLMDVTVVDAPNGGIYFNDRRSASGVQGNNTLRDITVVNAGGVGILFSRAPYSTLTNVTVTDITGLNTAGILVRGTIDGTGQFAFQNVTVARSDKYGIWLQGAAENTLTDVSVSDSGGDGIYVNRLGRNRLTDVSVVRSGGSGILVESGTGENLLRDITVSENGEHGIFVAGQATVPVSGNVFSGVLAADNGDSGIYSLFSSNDTFSDVTATGNARGGVFLVNSDDQTVTDAFLSDNSFGFAVVDGDRAIVERVTSLNHSTFTDFAVVRSTNATVTDLQLSSAKLSFTGSGFGFNSVDSPPAPPDGRLGIGAFFETVEVEPAPVVDVAVAYEDADVTAADVDESTLALFRYNETLTAWGELPGSSVDTTDDVVRATLTEAGVYGAFGEPADLAVEVEIGVKSGEEPTPINPDARGVIPVAILNTSEYDVGDVNVSSLRFGATDAVEAGGGAAPVHGGHFEDVDGDGDPDLVVHVPTADTGFAAGDTEALLVGEFADGTALFGTDTVTIVGRATTTPPDR